MCTRKGTEGSNPSLSAGTLAQCRRLSRWGCAASHTRRAKPGARPPGRRPFSYRNGFTRASVGQTRCRRHRRILLGTRYVPSLIGARPWRHGALPRRALLDGAPGNNVYAEAYRAPPPMTGVMLSSMPHVGHLAPIEIVQPEVTRIVEVGGQGSPSPPTTAIASSSFPKRSSAAKKCARTSHGGKLWSLQDLHATA